MTDIEQRARFETWYVENAFDYKQNPIGSRECGLMWKGWQAALALQPQAPVSAVTEISAELIDEALFYSLDENECGKGPETPMLLDAMGCGCEERLPYARRLLRGCLEAAMLATSKEKQP